METALSEEYSSSVNFSDGEIYLNLRAYDAVELKDESIEFAEKRMLGRLSLNKRKDLKQILKHRAFTMAFDALKVLPGLWGGFRIEHKFLSLRCHEVSSKPVAIRCTNV